MARVCGITLTSKEFARGDRAPLAGVPVARADRHIGRLVAAGHHVAVCDQVSEPGHGLVERRVVRIITAGTVTEPGLVPPTENVLLAAIRRSRHGIGLAHVDVTTGELQATVIDGPDAEAVLQAELQRLGPAECLVAQDEVAPVGAGVPTPLERARFDEVAADEALRRLFGVGSLDGYGLATQSPALGAIGAVVGYLEEKNRPLLASLREPRTYSVGAYMVLDPATRRNLELARTSWSGRHRGSLLEAIDRTRTPMGARRLRRALGQPLLDPAPLERRLDAVEHLVGQPERRARLRAGLSRLGDLERLLGRIRQGSATPRDALMLAQALRAVPALREEVEASTDDLGDEAPSPAGRGRGVKATPLKGSSAMVSSPHPNPLPAGEGIPLLHALASNLDDCADVADLIESALAGGGGGRMIRPGHSTELDELVDGIAGARRWLADLERRERGRTSIRSLRVGYNKVFGYYIEVTRPNLANVPPDYARRQTLANAERFVTPELKEQEALILTAEARIEELEQALFGALLRRVGERAATLVATVEALAGLDFIQSLADVAAERGWTRPAFSADQGVLIEGGRHPVLEAVLPNGEFVPNDCRLGSDNRILLVTGPNMAGKSTYLRQVALVVLLAQVGSFVPARTARLGPVDRIFTRVGSHDDLVAGASTFLVEMAETANILRHATSRSLVVLDEVGRGTSTHDGLCIAQAVVEHLHDVVGARTLFATHYHELTALAAELTGLRNVTVAVDDEDDRLAFLYRVVPGAADRSYGVQVARLAGLPSPVTDRAADLLKRLERPASDRVLEAAETALRSVVPLTRRPEDRLALGDGEAPDGTGQALAFAPEGRRGGPAGPPSSEATGQGGHTGPPLRDPRSQESDRDRDVAATLQAREAPITYDPSMSPPDDATARLLGELLGLDLSSLTPLQALNLLHGMQMSARESFELRIHGPELRVHTRRGP